MLHFESLLFEKVTVIVFYLNLSLCTQIPARVFFVWLFVCNENLPVWQKQSDSQNCSKIRLTKLEFGLVKRVALVFVDPLHSEVSQS